ncbi:uncharacterized protein AUP68_08538 [Ilyonectria robusta]
MNLAVKPTSPPKLWPPVTAPNPNRTETAESHLKGIPARDTAAEMTDHEPPKVVALTPALAKQFYPTLLLFVCLAAVHPYRRSAQDPVLDLTTGLEPLFRDFVSKLAFLCCTEPGGSAVAACAILQLPEGVQYVFGFNNRTSSELKHKRCEITRILHMLHFPLPATDSEKAALHRQILTAALAFSEIRIKAYLRSLGTQLQVCVRACEQEDTTEAQVIKEAFMTILQSLEPCFEQSPETLKESVSIHAVLNLIESIDQLFKSNTFVLVGPRLAREENLMSARHWSDCIHVAGRLLSYRRAVDVMLLVASTWPQLFDKFQICMIPSSSGISNALRGQPLTAERIVGKMTGDQELIGRLSEQLQQLSAHDLDGDIRQIWSQASKPIVHAEVLVHHWLENTQGGIRPERFFNRWKFIGSSKPPCKLCSYFFDEYPTDVQVRPSHQNVYFPWRMPDIYEHQGHDAAITRMRVMGRIKTRICADIARILSERLSDGRPHDSSTYTALAPCRMPGIDGGPPAETATGLSLSLLRILDREVVTVVHQRSADATNEALEEEDEVLLFQGRSSITGPKNNRQ